MKTVIISGFWNCLNFQNNFLLYQTAVRRFYSRTLRGAATGPFRHRWKFGFAPLNLYNEFYFVPRSFLRSIISRSRSRRSFSRFRNSTHKRARTSIDTPTVTHFSVVPISSLLGMNIIYLIAVYPARTAIVTLGFRKNLISLYFMPYCVAKLRQTFGIFEKQEAFAPFYSII